MKFLIPFALLLVLVVCADQNCPANQEYMDCGTACPPTCKNPSPEICTMQCVQGCFCKAGLVKADSGICINVKDCPASNHTCPKKEIWTTTGCGNPCMERCPNLKPMACNMSCLVGGSCQCIRGYCRDESGTCVPAPRTTQAPKRTTTSPHQCGRNEQWSNNECVMSPMCQGPKCPNNTIMVKCALICNNGGCVCKNGFYRDNSANCVRLDQCNVNVNPATP